MAEAVVFSLASKLLSTIASPAFEKAYERGLSIWEAKDELAKLRVTIETIQAVLLDAEKKQEGSAAVKNWIKRLKGILYDADDLFDEVATDDLLKQQQIMEGNNKFSLKKKVWVSRYNLNPIVSRDSIAKKVKDIRKSLFEISADMGQFNFDRRQQEEPIFGSKIGKDPGSFVDPKYVFGRDEDKKAILEMLFNESGNAELDVPVVVAIVGIGGMGKTTLAQLIYNDDEVKKNFEKKWFACISNTLDDKEVLGKIFQSICEADYSSFTLGQLQTKIRESIEGKKILLVLDDVWDEDHCRWQHRMSLLCGSAKESRIIVTTRSLSVAEAVEAFRTHNLDGLSENDSWDLFKKVAFASGKESDPRWTDLGREIVKKCARVPLAIRSIGSLLYTKTTIQEWESFRDHELSKLEGQSDPTSIMSVLRLSYDHLFSNLKHCFAYCSLFPKDFVFDVEKLIYIWIAQGYIRPSEEGKSVEEVGRSYFMSLLRRSFFQDTEEDDFGGIRWCKMHDLVHDLAQHVAGEETVMLPTPSSRSCKSAQHLCISYGTDCTREILPRELNMSRLRSFVLMMKESSVLSSLDQQLRGCKHLRTLDLSEVGIEIVPSSIGELKLLRYLDLSWNGFIRLPESMTSLVNLVALVLESCSLLKALPNDFQKLVNLRCLNIKNCYELKHMPCGMGEMSCLQYLSDFKVGKAASEVGEGVNKSSGLDVLARLQHQLRGELSIEFEDGIDEEKDWDGDECSWKLPLSLQGILIWCYPGRRIPHWANPTSLLLQNLGRIVLSNCPKVKYLPHFRYLPYLKYMCICRMEELEYMEEGEEINEVAARSVNGATALFFPCLEALKLRRLPKLKGWSRRNHHHVDVVVETSTSSSITIHQQLSFSFPLLSQLSIYDCPEIKSMPSSPSISVIVLENVGGEVVEQLLSPTSPNSTTPSSSPLKEITIANCERPVNFPCVAYTSLQKLRIRGIDGLNILHLASSLSLLYMAIQDCRGPISFPIISSLQRLEIMHTDGLEFLQLAYPRLRGLSILKCSGLTRVQVEAPATSLDNIVIRRCPQLKNLHIAHPNVVEELMIGECPELELTSVDWDSLPNLRRLMLHPLPPSEELPKCLAHFQALGNLQITDCGRRMFYCKRRNISRQLRLTKKVGNLDAIIGQGASFCKGTNQQEGADQGA